MRLTAIGTVATVCVVLCATASAGNPPDVVRRCFLRSDRRRAVARSARTLTGNAHRARTRSSRRSSSARRLSGRDRSATCRSRRSSMSSASTGWPRSSMEARSRSTTSSRWNSAAPTTSPISARKRQRSPVACPATTSKDKLENKVQTWSVPVRSRCGRRSGRSPGTGRRSTRRCSGSRRRRGRSPTAVGRRLYDPRASVPVRLDPAGEASHFELQFVWKRVQVRGDHKLDPVVRFDPAELLTRRRFDRGCKRPHRAATAALLHPNVELPSALFDQLRRSL